MKSFFSLAPVLLLLVLSSGCAALRPRAPQPELGRPDIVPGSIRAEATVELKKDGSSVTGRALILALDPDSFRIEISGPFNHVAAIIVSDGKSLYFFSGGKKEVFEKDSPDLPYGFGPDEVVSFLLGSAGSLKTKPSCEVITDEGGHMTRFVRYRNGSPALTAAMSDFRAIDGAHVPFSVLIEDGTQAIRIRYNSVEINPLLHGDLFDIAALP